MIDEDEIKLQMIGHQIRAARERIGLTQEELAARMGKTQRSVSDYEKGLRAVRITELPLLARTLAVDIEYFFKDSAAPDADRDDPYARLKIFTRLNFSFQFFIMDLLEQLALFQSRASLTHPEFWNMSISDYFQHTKRRFTRVIKHETGSITVEERRNLNGRVATFSANVNLYVYNHPDVDWPHATSEGEEEEPIT